MHDVSAVVFDCFGVLYPTYVDNFFEKHRSSFGNDIELLDKLNAQIDLGQISQTQFYKAIEMETGIPVSQIKVEMEADLIIDSQVLKLIIILKTKYKIGLLSNAGQEEISVIYKDKINGLFDAMSISYEVGDVKPNPKIFTACLDKLHVLPEESVFVDDNIKNLAGAQRLGMQTIHYPTFGTIPNDLLALANQN